MKFGGSKFMNLYSSIKFKPSAKRIKSMVLTAALRTDAFKHSLHYFIFRILISITSTMIVSLSCFLVPNSNIYLKFILEIIACLYVQKLLVFIHPFLLSLKSQTTFITDVLIVQSQKALFLYTCELCFYFVVYLSCFVINISSEKVQYMLLQQAWICTYNNAQIIHSRYVYYREYTHFQFVEYPRMCEITTKSPKQKEKVHLKKDGTVTSITLVHNYF